MGNVFIYFDVSLYISLHVGLRCVCLSKQNYDDDDDDDANVMMMMMMMIYC